MRNLLIPLTLGLAFAHAAAAYAVSPVEPKVIFVVIDGIRDLELQGKAKDDQGKPVAASALFPSLLALKSKGVFFPEMHISNPAGISLPAYSDLFAGRRQEKIVSNSPPKEDLHSHYPTIFQAVHAGLKLAEDAVAVIASWKPICNVSATLPESAPENGFFRSCGWKKEGSFKP
ncbi:MAG: hypothetical protein ACXVBW_09870, partial [Bdellovibrionota bacterium]